MYRNITYKLLFKFECIISNMVIFNLVQYPQTFFATRKQLKRNLLEEHIIFIKKGWSLSKERNPEVAEDLKKSSKYQISKNIQDYLGSITNNKCLLLFLKSNNYFDFI